MSGALHRSQHGIILCFNALFFIAIPYKKVIKIFLSIHCFSLRQRCFSTSPLDVEVLGWESLNKFNVVPSFTQF